MWIITDRKIIDNVVHYGVKHRVKPVPIYDFDDFQPIFEFEMEQAQKDEGKFKTSRQALAYSWSQKRVPAPKSGQNINCTEITDQEYVKTAVIDMVPCLVTFEIRPEKFHIT